MFKNIPLYRMLLVMMAASFVVTSCDKKDDGEDKDPETETVVLSGRMSENRELSADTIYELAGYVVVDSGVTLTINAGTIVKGREGAGSAASALIVARGAKINANGTSAKPIVFTSTLDNITVGQKFGTNLTKANSGLWGGLIVLGSAKVSTTNGDTKGQIEGIPAEYTFGLYGGTNDADNSGSITYVSIRHSGTELEPNQELQGLTLGGVGNGTVINHVEIFASSDDGIEIFGGSVNLSDVIITYCEDDGLDFDQNYSGTVTNFLVLHEGASAGNSGLEIDGPEGTTYTTGKFTITNGTVKSLGGSGRAATLKSAAQGTINNVAFVGFTSWINVEGGAAVTHFIDGDLVLNNCQVVKSSLTGAIKPVKVDGTGASTLSLSDSLAVIAAFELTGNTNTAVTTPTVGATQSAFATWTWSSNANLLD
ncbi:hypothetical protein BH09BAC1_BH09BAC1_25990 [soil metagenome]